MMGSFLKRADTLVALAEQIGVDGEGLRRGHVDLPRLHARSASQEHGHEQGNRPQQAEQDALQGRLRRPGRQRSRSSCCTAGPQQRPISSAHSRDISCPESTPPA